MTDSSEVLVVFTTFPEETAAAECVERLVEERLVACGQIASTGIRSFYRWEGELRREEEVLVLLKTSIARWELLQSRLIDLHPYDVPEIVAVDARASQAYGAWLHRACSPQPD